jgi:hypothetical protein
LCPPDDLRLAADMVTRVLASPDTANRLARNAVDTSRRYTWKSRGGQVLGCIQARLGAGNP